MNDAPQTNTAPESAETIQASAPVTAPVLPSQPQGVQPHSAPAVSTVPARRVGTFTMGIALIVTGIVLCVAMFYPSFEVWLLFRFAPLLLVLLGIEVLVSHARAKTIPLKYDLLSMFLCGMLILFAIGVTGVSAAILYESGFYGTEYGYHAYHNNF